MSKLTKCLLALCCVWSMMLISVASYAQDAIKVKGKVVAAGSGAPLPGATIEQDNGRVKTVADENGNFEISLSPKSRITISMVGYLSRTLAPNAKTTVFELDPKQGGMDEVVVLGYTAQKRELLSGSVVSMKMSQADIEMPTTSAGNLLAGRLAGVNVSTPNGLPGSQPSITIRTGSSSNAAPVLYVIDGKISGAGDFNNLSPNEIDNVTVLKDAATTAAYGSRAAGGVVLVITKKGAAGKAQIQYSVNAGKDVRGKNMELESAVQWGNVYARIWGYGVAGPAGCPWLPADSVYFATHDFGGGLGYGFNLLKDVYRNPSTTTHNVSVSGGTDKVKYFVGGSYVNQQSFLKSLDFKKYNLRANITADLNRDFSIFASMGLNDNLTYGPSGTVDGDMYSKLLVWQPYMPSFTTSGKPIDYFWITNKSAEANGAAGYNNGEGIKTTANLSVTYKVPVIPGLSAKASFMKSYTNNQNKIFTKPFTYYQVKQTDPVMWGITDADIVSSRLSYQTPQLEQQANWSKDQQLDLQLAYTRSFGQHHVNGNLVYERTEASGAGIDGWIQGFPLYTTDQWWAATSTGIINNSPTKGVSNSYGVGYLNGRKDWIGQFIYDYAGKYVANFTYRYNGSMNFAPDQRWGFFPSGSAAWIISKEKFFSNVRGIQMLKLRVSAGLTGNDNVGGWQWQASYKGGSNSFFGSPSPALGAGLQYGGVVNPNITWEKYFNKNIGVDLTFLDHFNATVEVWQNYTYDILGQRIQTTPPSFSLSLPAVNYGKEKAKGIDASLSYNKKFGAVNFTGGLTGSYGYAWFVTKDQNVTYDYQNQIGNGRATTMVTGYLVDHMIRTQADLDAWNAAHPGYKFNGYAAQVGQFVYKDLGSARGVGNGDSIINNYDIAVLRKRNNPVVLGLNLGAEWKGIAIYATFNGAVNYWRSFGDLNGGVEWNRMWSAWYDQSWTPTNTNAWLPKQYSTNDGTKSVNYSGSSFWFADASFLRLKFLNISYTIPPKFYRKYVQSIRFYGSGSNLFVISKFNKKFYDPEMGSGTAFPIVKSFNAGCTITF
ncbi:MAG: SusC/RagA family TonB-linked outer membrane protein [Niabella sp.]|nr:SusC/RagA family TonB-linked outer membrane protein [Niabella sp.]